MPTVSNEKSIVIRAAVAEHARAPEGPADREAPFRGREQRIELAHLEDADRRVHPLGDDREADVAPGRAFALRPGNEALEPVDRGWRRRDEARHLLTREELQQSLRVRDPELAQRQHAVREHRQDLTPIRHPGRRDVRGSDAQSRQWRRDDCLLSKIREHESFPFVRNEHAQTHLTGYGRASGGPLRLGFGPYDLIGLFLNYLRAMG